MQCFFETHREFFEPARDGMIGGVFSRRSGALRALAGGVVALVLVGCGSGEGVRLDGAVADRLHSAIGAVRSAAAGGDRRGALRALDGLSGQVERAARAGDLTGGELRAMRAGIAQSRRRVGAELPAPAPAPAQTSTSTAERPSPPQTGKDNEGKGKGHGREGKGKKG